MTQTGTTSPSLPILIVDDELAAARGCRYTLESAGLDNTIVCTDSTKVEALVDKQEIGLVLLDLSMPDLSGDVLLRRLRAQAPHIPIIVITGINDVDTAVQCVQDGAFDYMVKPVEEARLVSGVQRAAEIRELRHEAETFRERVFSGRISQPEAFADILTGNPMMKSVFQYVETVAPTARPLLITGETGVGKELIAQALHRASGRRGDFVPVNVAGLDDNMFSDTLFGHTKGAFTGAMSRRDGLVARAENGTLFLDEIGDLPPQSQVKLLRLLQEREYLPLGADAPRETSARVVAATNRTLESLKDSPAFRRDLFFRLQTHHVHIPPLRQRLDDLPLLAEAFLARAAESLGSKTPTAPRQLAHLLSVYPFPGNVRELEAMCFDAVSMHSGGVLSLESFRRHIQQHMPQELVLDAETDGPLNPFEHLDTLPSLKDASRLLIEEAMRRAEGNQSVAAGLVGISRSGLSKAIKRQEEAGC